jgi:hypothetical protein
MSAHALADLTRADGPGFLADCVCGLGFWGLDKTAALTAHQSHQGRLQAPQRVTDTPDGRVLQEADGQQYGYEEDHRLTQQLGAWT